MQWKPHLDIKGQHAFLSPSSPSWLNYDEEKLAARYLNHLAVAKGTRMHDVAHELIELGIIQKKSSKTFNSFVNDAIGYRMSSEQPLYFSHNCFGTSDAISCDHGVLRVHDLKTGSTQADIRQLLVYAALYLLEYGVKPDSVKTELRIYQNDEIMVYNPAVDEIVPVMDKIISFDKQLTEMQTEGLL